MFFVFRITCANPQIVHPTFCQTDIIGAATVLVCLWIILSIILPEANMADFVSVGLFQRGISATRTAEEAIVSFGSFLFHNVGNHPLYSMGCIHLFIFLLLFFVFFSICWDFLTALCHASSESSTTYAVTHSQAIAPIQFSDQLDRVES